VDPASTVVQLRSGYGRSKGRTRIQGEGFIRSLLDRSGLAVELFYQPVKETWAGNIIRNDITSLDERRADAQI
jgi:hypothetical protein